MEWSGYVALIAVCCVIGLTGLGGSAAAGGAGAADPDSSATAAEPTVSDTLLASVGDGSGSFPIASTHSPVVSPSASATDHRIGSYRSTRTAPPPLGVETQQEFDRTEFRIQVNASGDAQWIFRFRRVIDSEEEREQFTTFAEQFRTEETDFYRSFRAQAINLAETGGSATGRTMEATDFERSAGVQEQFGNEIGIVEIRFRWTNFAVREDDGTVRVGDVFEGNMFIGDGQRLVLETGDELQFESVEPDGTLSSDTLEASDSVTWEGEREFVDGQPRAVLVPVGGTQPVDESGGIGLSPIGAATGLAFVAMLVAGVFVLYQRGVFERSTPASAGSEATIEQPEESPPEPAISDEELLTDEDRVVQLIEGQGGRMKQVDIVEETGWSKSKVSMLLSDMEADGTISKIRVGRENIVALAGHEPEVVGSPFDDKE